ncbi:MAG: hypothetical protein HGA45_21690, partial [Chloroflexales bacterium]|nr:hypothetical protein [Chloroflexales bacterium]
VLRGLDALPPEVGAARPGLLLWRAWIALLLPDWPALLRAIAQAELALAAHEPPGSPRWGELLALQGWLARFAGDVAASYDLSMRALALLGPDDLLWHSLTSGSAAQAAQGMGNAAVAQARAVEAIVSADRSASSSMSASARATYAFILIEDGQLSQAAAVCGEALAVMAQHRQALLPIHAYCHIALAQVALLRNDLVSAHQGAEAALALLTTGALKDAVTYAPHVQLAVDWAQGDAGALADRRTRQEHEVRTIGIAVLEFMEHAQRAWMALLDGHTDEAAALLETVPQDIPKGTGTHSAVRIARALLRVVQGCPAEALELLAAGLHATAMLSVPVTLLVPLVRALALDALGQPDAANQTLAEALGRAAPEGLIRPFLDLGHHLAPSLRRLRRALPETHPAHRLAGTALAQHDHAPAAKSTPGAPERQPSALSAQPLVEPLSARELEVLALLAAGATNQQIGDQLRISERTAKKHVINILGKLNAANRTQAVALARAMGLIP